MFSRRKAQVEQNNNTDNAKRALPTRTHNKTLCKV